jgi:nicotinamidase-related amidase
MNTALLIIDIQRGLFDEEPRPYEADEVVTRINALCRRGREQGAKVVFIQHERLSGNLEYGSESWQLEKALQTAPTDYFIRKTTPDAFLRTDLQELLASQLVTRVVICGYASEFCVDTTTRRAAALGYSVTLAADAHTTHDKEHLPAVAIRAHENATLPNITSFGPAIVALASAQVTFSV